MSERLEKLRSLVNDKNCMLVCHWDADGITSGAIIYHLIKDYAKSIETKSKGEVFRVTKDDVKGDPDIVLCIDIKPGEDLDNEKVIYIDHHPMEEGNINTDDYLYSVFDKDSQSCSLMVWNEIIPETNNPYFIFLSLLGFFGDGGNKEDIPLELEMKANELLKIQTKFGVHDLMERKKSFYGSGEYLEIERYVSALNTGKRMNWCGDVPFELMKNIDDFKPFIYNHHPIAQQLQDYKAQLRNYYNMNIEIKDAPKLQYSMIDCDKNVQGVLCARHMKDKPFMCINRRKDEIIASMRVPDHIEFDAGAFLNGMTGKVPTLVGGGHEKAGGVTFKQEYLDLFLELIKES